MKRSAGLWPRKRLDEVAVIASGNSIPAKDRRGKFASTKIKGKPFISTKDVGLDGRIELDTEVAIPAAYAGDFRLALAGATLVCSEGGSAGRKIGWLNKDAHYGNKLFAVVASKHVNPKFLYYFHRTDDFSAQFKDRMTGLIGGVSLNKFKSISLPLPPLEEQKRIVAVVDQAFAALDCASALAEANLADAEELFASFLMVETDKLPTGKVSKLSALTDFITDGTHQTPKYFDSGWVFLSSKNVKNGIIDWDEVKYLDDAQHEAMQKRLAPQVGDILLRKNGAGYGKAAIVDRNVIFDVYVSLAVLRPNGILQPKLMLQLINSAPTMKQFNARIKGQGVPNLHLQEIREVELSFPSDGCAQKALSEKLDLVSIKIDRIVTEYSRKLVEIDELRQSLLRKAIAGELT